MTKFTTWFFLLLLILIHTIDMELTRYYIGDNYEIESFPPMSECIKILGIENSIWASRIIMYFYFWLTLMNQNKRRWLYFLIIVTILYWTAMIPWVFQLRILNWPFPHKI